MYKRHFETGCEAFTYRHAIGCHLLNVESTDAVLRALHRAQRGRGRMVALTEWRGAHAPDWRHAAHVTDGWRWEAQAVTPHRVRVFSDGMNWVEWRICCCRVGIWVGGSAGVEAGRWVAAASARGRLHGDDARAAVISGAVAAGTLKTKTKMLNKK